MKNGFLIFICIFICIGFAFGQGDADLNNAITLFNVKSVDVPVDAKGAGIKLMEFKRRMKLLDQRVKDQINAAPDWQKKNGATDLELDAYKKSILTSSMNESKNIARRFRDPAMARLVADANRGLKPSAKIKLAGGTGPKGKSYRGGFGDIDLQAHSQAIKRFKDLFDQASIPEKTSNKAGYLSYEDVDITIHRMGRMGDIGSSTLKDQVIIDAGSKETYVSSAMLPNQIGKNAVLLQDHMKKALKGARLTPSKLMNSPDALQSFAKGTAKCVETAGLTHRSMKKLLRNAGYTGSVTSFKQKLLLLKAEGYDRAPKEIGLDADGMRVFKKAALSLISASDQKAWSSAQKAMHNERLKITELRNTRNPAKIAEANSRQASLEDSTMRLNETFAANKKRFHWMGDRNKIKFMLTSPHTEKMRFISYLSEAPNGRRIGLSFLLDQARKDPAAARRIIEELPPHVRARMRENSDFAAFEAELQKTSTPVWKQEVHLPAFAARCKNRIDRINGTINQSIQNCAYSRGFAKGMSYYGKLTEAQSYYQSWDRGGPEELIVDIIRKRVPFMTTVEYAMMGNYLMAGWDVICTVLPPVGLLSAAGNIGMGIGKVGVNCLYEYELLDFEEELYRSAKFELTGVTSLEDAKLGQWKFISFQQGERVITREKLLDGWPTVPPGASILITNADPVLATINEMMKHPDVGKRLLYGKDGFGGYMQQYLSRKEQVLKWWAQKAIANMELRKTAQDAWVRGQLPIMYAQLMKIAKSLKIESEINGALDKDMGSGFLDPLRQWIRDVTFRDNYIQGTGQSSFREEQAAKAVVQYLEVYRKVLAARERAEKHAELNPKTDKGIRILTGPKALLIDLAEDSKSSRKWSSFPLLKKTELHAKLSAIKARYLDQAELTTPYDRDTLKQLLTHAVWLQAWTDAIRVSQHKKIVSSDYGMAWRNLHHTRFDTLLKAYEAHYAELSVGSIQFDIVEKIQGMPAGKPVRGALLSITDSSGTKLKVPSTGEGSFLLKRTLPGNYQYSAEALGYHSTKGGPKATGFVRLELNPPSCNETIHMEPIPGSVRMEIIDDLGVGVPLVSGMMEGTGRPPMPFKADSHGNVILKNVISGTYLIELFTPGYKAPQKPPKLVLDLAHPKKHSPQPLKIKLTPILSTVKLKVQDSRKLPVEGATISVSDMEKTSDANGLAVFHDVRPSQKLHLQAVKSGLLTTAKTIDLRPTTEGNTVTQTLEMKGGMTLSVRVRDEETNELMENAEVQVSSSQSHASIKTKKGLAKITGLPPDFMYITVSKNGYLTVSNVEVDLRKDVGTKDILLQRGMKLTVFVLDENKLLLPGAYAQMDKGSQLFAPTGTVAFSPVKKGTRLFKASALGYNSSISMYTANPELKSEDKVVIYLMPGMTILGEIRDEQGLLLRGAPSHLQLMRDGNQIGQATGPRFLFSNLEPGNYSIVASAVNYESRTSQTVTLKEAPTSRTLAVKLLTTGLLTVAVKAHDGSQSILPEGVNVELSGPGVNLNKPGVVVRFPNLLPGTYVVKASAKGFSTASQSVTIEVGAKATKKQVTLHLNKIEDKKEDKKEQKEENPPVISKPADYHGFDIDEYIKALRYYYVTLYDQQVQSVPLHLREDKEREMNMMRGKIVARTALYQNYIEQVTSNDIETWFHYLSIALDIKSDVTDELDLVKRRMEGLNPNVEDIGTYKTHEKRLNRLLTRAESIKSKAHSLLSRKEIEEFRIAIRHKSHYKYSYEFAQALYEEENSLMHNDFPERVAGAHSWGEKRYADEYRGRKKRIETALSTIKRNFGPIKNFHTKITAILKSTVGQEIEDELKYIRWAIEDARRETRTGKYHVPFLENSLNRDQVTNMSVPSTSVMGFSPKASYDIIENYFHEQAKYVQLPKWSTGERERISKLQEAASQENEKIRKLFGELRTRTELYKLIWNTHVFKENSQASLLQLERELSRERNKSRRQQFQERIQKMQPILGQIEALEKRLPMNTPFKCVYPVNAYLQTLYDPYLPNLHRGSGKSIPYPCWPEDQFHGTDWIQCRWKQPPPDRIGKALESLRFYLNKMVEYAMAEEKTRVMAKELNAQLDKLKQESDAVMGY